MDLRADPSATGRLLNSSTTTHLYDAFGDAVRDLGGKGFAVAALIAAGDIIVSQHRGLGGWCEHFEASGYGKDCPITERLRTAVTPFTWAEVHAGVANQPRQRAVLDVGRDFGLTDGLIVPVRSFNGSKGNVFVAVDADEQDENAALALTSLALTFHSQLTTLQTEPVPERVELSTREHEVLSWLAEGKCAEDVGDILGISAATVMFHYRAVAQRLGTLNRTHTVVEAVRRGILPLH